LNSGSGFSGGHLPHNTTRISACCSGDVSLAAFGLGQGTSIVVTHCSHYRARRISSD
jgi:hypothetical protein